MKDNIFSFDNLSKKAMTVCNVFLFLLVFMPIFGNLDYLTIRLWDESRLACNAYEMYKNGNLIVTHYNGEPDMWNTKPPVMIWLQLLMMKIFGPNEFAVRFPSALATLFTCCFLLYFFTKYQKKYWLGFIVVILLTSSSGYVRLHGTRTGDYDALLTFFTTVAYLLLFLYIEKNRKKFLYLFFLMLAFAILTKSIAGLMFLPGVFIYLLWRSKLASLLKDPSFYIGLFGFLIIVVGYYVLRESYNPGYLKAVAENELGGRFNEIKEEHKHGVFYYLNNILSSKVPYFFLIPFGIYFGLKSQNENIKRFTFFASVLSGSFLIFISLSRTKLSWYDLPLYPFLAFFVGLFIYKIITFIAETSSSEAFLKVKKMNILSYLILFLILLEPYRSIFEFTYFPRKYDRSDDAYKTTYFLRDGVKGVLDLNDHVVITDGYEAHNEFYIKQLKDNGVRIEHINIEELSAPKNNVVTQSNSHKKYINENFEYEEIHYDGNLIVYNIIAEKKRNN